MSLITLKEAAAVLKVDNHNLRDRMMKIGIEVLEGPKFGRGRMSFIRATDIEEARKRFADQKEKQRQHLATVGAGSRIVTAAPVHEKLDQINQKLDRLLMMWSQNG